MCACAGEEVELTAQEFRLLHLLASHPGIVFSREALLSRVWPDHTYVTLRSVDTLVKRLRRRVEVEPAEPALDPHHLGQRVQVRRCLNGDRRRWYRSLYWRIALGFIVLLAVMLVAQAASFVWLAVQTEQGQPERVGQDFAELVATDFECCARTRLVARPEAVRHDAARPGFHRPAFVVFPDGTVIGPPGEEVPPGIERFAGVRHRGPRGRRRAGRPVRPPGGTDPPGPGRTGRTRGRRPGAPPPQPGGMRQRRPVR